MPHQRGAQPLPNQGQNYRGTHLLQNLNVGNHTEIFGIAYSILTWSGVTKNVGINPKTWASFIVKNFDNGHATTFMIDIRSRQRRNRTLTMTGMGDTWVFDHGRLDRADWARPTHNAATDVYYTSGPGLADRFRAVQDELEEQDATTYAVLWPNIPGRGRYENCVSSSHYIMYKMGMGHWARTKGWWIPSLSNHATWWSCRGTAWNHRRFPNCNTHIP